MNGLMKSGRWPEEIWAGCTLCGNILKVENHDKVKSKVIFTEPDLENTFPGGSPGFIYWSDYELISNSCHKCHGSDVMVLGFNRQEVEGKLIGIITNMSDGMKDKVRQMLAK